MKCVLKPHTYLTEDKHLEEEKVFILFQHFLVNIFPKCKKNRLHLPGGIGLRTCHSKPPGEQPGVELQIKFASEPWVSTAYWFHLTDLTNLILGESFFPMRTWHYLYPGILRGKMWLILYILLCLSNFLTYPLLTLQECPAWELEEYRTFSFQLHVSPLIALTI